MGEMMVNFFWPLHLSKNISVRAFVTYFKKSDHKPQTLLLKLYWYKSTINLSIYRNFEVFSCKQYMLIVKTIRLLKDSWLRYHVSFWWLKSHITTYVSQLPGVVPTLREWLDLVNWTVNWFFRSASFMLPLLIGLSAASSSTCWHYSLILFSLSFSENWQMTDCLLLVTLQPTDLIQVLFRCFTLW